MKTLTPTGWYAYLEANGLQEADPQTLAVARKQYHNEWKRAWRQKQKGKRSYYMPYFESTHNTLLIETAKRHEVSPTAFIQGATLAQLHSTAMTPQLGSFRKILQVLNVMLNQLQEKNTLLPEEEREELRFRLSAAEQLIKTMYFNPADMEQVILQGIKSNPQIIHKLKEVLNLT